MNRESRSTHASTPTSNRFEREDSKKQIKQKSSFELRPMKRPHLNDYLNVVYLLSRSVRYEQFLSELGVDDGVICAASKLKPTVALTAEGETYTLTTTFADLPPAILRFKVAEPMRRQLPNGRTVVSVFEIHENKLTEKQDLGDGEIIIKRKFGAKDLTVTMKVNEVKCQRFYKSIESRHSILTETSRRQSIRVRDSDYEVPVPPPVESFIEEVPDSRSQSEELCI